MIITTRRKNEKEFKWTPCGWKSNLETVIVALMMLHMKNEINRIKEI